MKKLLCVVSILLYACFLSEGFPKDEKVEPFFGQKTRTSHNLEPKLWVELLSFDEKDPVNCIELVKGKSEQDFSPGHNSWFAEMRKYTLSGYTKGKLSSRWKEYTFAFIPKKSGRIWLRIGGRWSREEKEQNSVLVNFVKLNGVLMKNGDFELCREVSKEKRVPVGWQLWGRAKLCPEDGDQKTPACLVNHSNRLVTSFLVEAEKEYRITVKAKLPSGRIRMSSRKDRNLVF